MSSYHFSFFCPVQKKQKKKNKHTQRKKENKECSNNYNHSKNTFAKPFHHEQGMTQDQFLSGAQLV